ncbi:MAG: DUF4340 domain-containing protein [Desulfosarcina sp.]
MKSKTFLMLLVAAGVLAALFFVRYENNRSSQSVELGERLFADLPVNQVAEVAVADAEDRVTLVKGDQLWQVKERDGYPADFDELRDTVVKLSRLKIGRSFSGTTESLSRLSLMPPGAADATGTGKQITLTDGSGKILADVILGQTRETDDGATGGQYLKKADDDTIFLVDGQFRFLKTAPSEWLDNEILDVKAQEVASVACSIDGKTEPLYVLARPEKDAAARMTPVPNGRTADPAKIEQVFDALAPLTIDDVRSADSPPPAAQSTRARLDYRLYDGRLISVYPESEKEDSYTLRLTVENAEGDPSPVAEAEKTPSIEGGATDGAEAKTPAPEPKTADQLDEALRPWIFSIKKWQYDSFITQPESLLEEVKKEGEGTS